MANSETLTVLEIDGATGQTVERELTAEEVAQREALQAEVAASQAQAEAKATARASALAKLADLGLTPEEIAAL